MFVVLMSVGDEMYSCSFGTEEYCSSSLSRANKAAHVPSKEWPSAALVPSTSHHRLT